MNTWQQAEVSLGTESPAWLHRCKLPLVSLSAVCHLFIGTVRCLTKTTKARAHYFLSEIVLLKRARYTTHLVYRRESKPRGSVHTPTVLLSHCPFFSSALHPFFERPNKMQSPVEDKKRTAHPRQLISVHFCFSIFQDNMSSLVAHSVMSL